jgi:DNA-binding response OmpR family regulator
VLPRGERFIAKPFSPDELVHAVATAIRSDDAALVHAGGGAAAD